MIFVNFVYHEASSKCIFSNVTHINNLCSQYQKSHVQMFSLQEESYPPTIQLNHVHNLKTSLFYPCARTFKEEVRTICPLHYYKGTKKEMVMMKSNSHDTFVLNCLELWLVMSGCIVTQCLLSVCSSKISSTFCGLLTSKSEDDKDFSRYFCQLKDLVNKQIKCASRCLAHFVF